MNDRPLHENTAWIICVWDIKGDDPAQTATVLKRSLEQVTDTIRRCKENGFYERVRRHVEYFEEADMMRALAGFADVLKTQEVGEHYER